MATGTRASFDGWRLVIDAPTERAGVEHDWSDAPDDGSGLFVDEADDARVDALTPPSSLLLRGALTRHALARLLARAPELRRLALVDCTALTGGFERVAESALEELWICGATGLTLRGLKPLANAHGLTGLFLDGTAPASLLRWLAAFSFLVRLDLSRARDDADVGRALAGLAALPRLEQLALRGARITETTIKNLAALPALRRLDLSGASLGAPPSAWRKLRQLTELRLRGASHLDRALAALEGMTTLTLLDVRDQPLAPKHFDRLRGALPNARVLVSAPPSPAPASPMAASTTAAPPRARPRTPAPPPPSDPLRWPTDAPTIEALHVVIPDERNQPNGFDLRHDVHATARRFHARHIIAGLGDDATTAQRLTGLLLLPLAVRAYDSDADLLTDDAIAAARVHLGDDDGVTWQWGHGNQAYRFSVGRLAAAAVLGLLAWRADRRGAALTDDLALIRSVLFAELARTDGTPWSVASHLLGRARDPGFADAVAAWLGWLRDVVLDPKATPAVRIAALERLDMDRVRMPPQVSALVDEAWQRALTALARAAAADETEMRFRRAARTLVAARAPALLDAMRAAGELPNRSLPPFSRVIGPLGAADERRVLPMAPDIDGATCLAALAAPPADASSLDLCLAALAFAPHCGDASEARALAERAASLVGRRDVLDLGDDAPVRHSEALGERAACALAQLVRQRRVPIDGLVERVLAALRGVPLDPMLTTPPGVLTAIAALAPAGDRTVAPAVRARFFDRTAPAAERFVLLLAAFPLRAEHAARVLMDQDEDGDLRALIGCLSGVVPAAALAHEPALPMVEPQTTVPLPCVRASLALGSHPVSVRRATQVLVSRLLPWDADADALLAGAEGLRAVPLPASLRDIVDAGAGFGRIAAARWLAIRGDAEDEARIARVMFEEGGWTATRPQGRDARTPLEHMMAALMPETVVDACDSDFDALLEVGFGEARARRIRAKAYVHIARRHIENGRLAFGRRSLAFAAALDPLSLDVKRLERTLK